MSRHLSFRLLSILVVVSMLLGPIEAAHPVVRASTPAEWPTVPDAWPSAWNDVAESLSVRVGRQHIQVPLSRGPRNALLSDRGSRSALLASEQTVRLDHYVAAVDRTQTLSRNRGVDLRLAPDPQTDPPVRPVGTNQDMISVADPQPLDTDGLTFFLYLPVVLRHFPAGTYAEITPDAGGVLISPDGQATIAFARGAVDVLARSHYTDSTPRNLPPSLRAVGRTFDLAVQRNADNVPITLFPPEVVTYTVHNAEFDGWQTMYVVTPTVHITISYSAADVSRLQEGRLRLYRQDPSTSAWKAMPTVVDANRNLVRATIERDGRYTLLGPSALNTGQATSSSTLSATQIQTATQVHVVLDPDHGGSNPGGLVFDPPEFAT